MALPTRHNVKMSEQKNGDRYDCWHANCECGWHGQAPTKSAAEGLGNDHATLRGGGVVSDAGETRVVRPPSQSKPTTKAQESEPVGGLSVVAKPQTLKEKLEAMKASSKSVN